MRTCPSLILAASLFTPVLADTQKPAPAAQPAPVQPAGSPAVAPSKKDDLQRLMRLLGTGKSNSDAARYRIATAKKDPKFGSYPAAYWADLEKAASPEAFDKIIYPLFDQAYTHEDIKGLLKLVVVPEFKLWVQKNPMEKVAKEGFPLFSKYMDEQAKKARAAHLPESPKAEAPKPETPKSEAPKAETPKSETPKAGTPKSETPKAGTPKPETPKAGTPKS